MKGRPEALLEREVLRAIGGQHGIWLARNEQGVGLRAAVLGELCESCRRVASRHRITYGLAVGSPDIFGVVHGAAFGIELKSPRGVVRDTQHAFAAAIERNGCGFVHGIARDVAEAQAIVDRARRST